MSDEIPIEIRVAEEADVPFILSSYLRGNRQEGALRHMTHPAYYAQQTPVAVAMVRTARVLIAADVEDPWHILGWIAFSVTPAGELIVHYVYVKSAVRRFGVARRLFQHVNPTGAAVVATHTGRAFEALRGRYRLAYAPALAPSGGPMGGTPVPAP